MGSKGIAVDAPDDLDYAAAGFRAGLEIHQQLDTASKLFCRCSPAYRNDPPTARIVRHMRPTLSEMGTYDDTALMEFKTKKEVVYELYRDGVCTYEMDDTPPFLMSREALEKALGIAMALNYSIVDEVHVSRKQYLDGSIPTGFQRTAILGADGHVQHAGGRIELSHICLEEDACREMGDRGHRVVFRTDRLGTPLVEVISTACFLSPEEIMHGARILGDIMRATGHVRRGPGATRQDVNVSVDGGDRVEIKGVPRWQDIGALTRYEAVRQVRLLAIKDELNSRGVTPELIHSAPFADVTRIQNWPGSGLFEPYGPGDVHFALLLPRMSGIPVLKLQRDRSFGDDMRGMVRVVACLDHRNDLMFLEELPEYMTARVAEAVGAGPDDSVAVIHGPLADVRTAIAELRERLTKALSCVPRETRQALDSGTTDFERVLPGPDRMYPDTDSPPIPVTGDLMERCRVEVPVWPHEAEDELVSRYGLGRGAARGIMRGPYGSVFRDLVEVSGLAAPTLGNILGRLKARVRSGQGKLPDPETLRQWAGIVARDRMTPAGARNLLETASQGHDPGSAAANLDPYGLASLDDGGRCDILRSVLATLGPKDGSAAERIYLSGFHNLVSHEVFAAIRDEVLADSAP